MESKIQFNYGADTGSFNNLSRKKASRLPARLLPDSRQPSLPVETV
jgi:hypothetical protein